MFFVTIFTNNSTLGFMKMLMSSTSLFGINTYKLITELILSISLNTKKEQSCVENITECPKNVQTNLAPFAPMLLTCVWPFCKTLSVIGLKGRFDWKTTVINEIPLCSIGKNEIVKRLRIVNILVLKPKTF